MRPRPWAVPTSGAGSGMGVGPAVMVLAVLGPALLALGVAGLVPPVRGFDAPPSAFRYVTVPWLLPGGWLTYRAFATFRQAWRTVEEAGPSRETIRRVLLERQGELYSRHPPWSRPVLWEGAIDCPGCFKRLSAPVVSCSGSSAAGSRCVGRKAPGELLTSAAVVVAGGWVCLMTG
ncbi:MAG: hypothetical protein LC799_31165, partial [Actinobacteria bacterium]|nr:hypothetical protein [Actinomycetota bacterium]